MSLHLRWQLNQKVKLGKSHHSKSRRQGESLQYSLGWYDFFILHTQDWQSHTTWAHTLTYTYRHMGVHIRSTVVCRWDLFAKLNDDVDKSRLIASVADVNTVFDFQNVVFYFSIAGSHRMASVWIVDWFPFWQHAPLMPVVSPSSVSWSVIFFFAISHRILIVRCVQVSFGELVTCPITSPPRDREMYGMSTWYVGQAATLGIRIMSWCITNRSPVELSRSEVLLSALCIHV